MGNIRVNMKFGPVVQEEMSFKDIFLSRALDASLFGGLELFVQFWKKASWGTIL